eukprot:XP_015575932.1 myosin-binding protein 7 [Ricinus communis]
MDLECWNFKGLAPNSNGPTWQSSVDKESGCNSKGKVIVNQKQKSGIRRRRRVALGYGNLSSALSSTSASTHLAGIGVPHPLHDSSGVRSEFSENLDPGSSIEDSFLGDQNAPNSTDFIESMRHSFDFGGSSVEKFSSNTEDKLCSVGNDANVIRVLKQALEEEKAAHAALYQELEKERAAAATAADEALAMILRLQEDKASIEMEARQYHRLIEEKFVYDEEEMKILKEILVRREKEIHFLEKELDAYEQMNFLGNEQAGVNSIYEINDTEGESSLSVDSNVNPPPVPQQIENRKFVSEKRVETIGKQPSNYEHNHTLAFEKEMITEDLASDLSTSQELVQKTVSVAGKEESERDICMISPAMKAPRNCGAIEGKLEKDGEHQNQAGCNIMLDSESTVYDVHVVDDTAIVQSSKLLINCPTVSTAEIEPIVRGSSFHMHSKSLVLGNSLCKNFNIDSQRHSPSPLDGERLKIDSEVEWLRERLRIVQEEKEKLTFSAEHGERVNAQLKLVEDVVSQLREIQQLREPLRHASLPPTSSKASLKRRHRRSASQEDFESD